MPRKSARSTARINNLGTSKRAAPDTSPPPAAKRRKTAPATAPASYLNDLPELLSTDEPLHLFVWGSNEIGGSLGIDPSVVAEISRPRKHPWVSLQVGNSETLGLGVVDTAAGGMSTFIVGTNGIAWSCGPNDHAALGRVTSNVLESDTLVPSADSEELEFTFHPIQSLLEEGFASLKLSGGDSFGVALDATGHCRGWGSFRDNEGKHFFPGSSRGLQFDPVPVFANLGKDELVSSLTCGANHVVALTVHGHVYTFGMRKLGVLGRKWCSSRLRQKNSHTNAVAAATAQDLEPQRTLLGGTRTRKALVVGSGQETSFAVDDRGDVWAWGSNNYGMLGIGLHESELVGGKDAEPKVELPMRVDTLSMGELDHGETVIQIVGGERHSLFLTSNGRVFSCGAIDDGQVGLADDHPGLFHESGEKRKFVSVPALVSFPVADASTPPPFILQISANLRFSLAVSDDGTLWSWGFAPSGELGLGTTVDICHVPTVVSSRDVELKGEKWLATRVSCGSQHSVGLFKRAAPV